MALSVTFWKKFESVIGEFWFRFIAIIRFNELFWKNLQLTLHSRLTRDLTVQINCLTSITFHSFFCLFDEVEN